MILQECLTNRNDCHKYDKISINTFLEELSMEWKQIPLGQLQTNCYLLYNDQKDCLIFDPGAEGEKLHQMIETLQLKPLAIVLTHAHFDHIGAIEQMKFYYDLPVYVHELEAEWLTNPQLNGSARFIEEVIASEPDVLLTGEEVLEIGPFTLECMYTPGHSPGSVSYYVKDDSIIISGDVLFSRSVGRSDLVGGSHEQLIESIYQHLLPLDEDTKVLCGHGPVTTIGFEKQHNPFL